jgi:hypothetical protein
MQQNPDMVTVDLDKQCRQLCGQFFLGGHDNKAGV